VQTFSRERGLGLHFQVFGQNKLVLGTALSHQVASVHAAIEGRSVEEYVISRYGSIFEPREFAERVVELLADSALFEQCRLRVSRRYGYHVPRHLIYINRAQPSQRWQKAGGQQSSPGEGLKTNERNSGDLSAG
jgi:hypothetical protein